MCAQLCRNAIVDPFMLSLTNVPRSISVLKLHTRNIVSISIEHRSYNPRPKIEIGALMANLR